MNRLLSFTAVLLLLASSAQAQNTGEIFGKVSDTSAAALPGVTVTVSSPVLLQPRVALTGETGTYDFPGLAIGVYAVRFELGGFAAVVREGIQIQAGFNAQINAQLPLASLKEDVVVTGVSPVIDLRSTTSGEHLNADDLQTLPSGRDVFSMFQKAPAIAVNTANVGGNTLGAQTLFISRGANASQVRTFADGADTGTGSNMPFYIDFDSIEELQINTGGADVTMQTSGATINMVSKSGGDKFRGSTRFYVTDQKLEADNVDDTLRKQGASTGSPLLNVKDYGFEVGGPLKRGRAWFWAALSQQQTSAGVLGFYQNTDACHAIAANPLAYPVGQVNDCLNPATSDLKHINYKITAQPFAGNQFSLRNSYDLKEAINRGADNLHAPAATTRLLAIDDTSYGAKLWTTGWPPLWRFADQHIFSDRWIMEGGYARFCPCTNIALASDALVNVQPEQEISTGAFDRSFSSSINFTVKHNVNVTTSYFLPGKLAGDHNIKAGFKYLNYPMVLTAHTGGNATAQFNSGALAAFSTPFAALFSRDSIRNQYLNQQSLYVQDTYTHSRLTLNLGVRWDRQNDRQGAATVPASPYQGQLDANGVPFTFLPAVSFPGVESGVVFNNVAPRLGLTYDLTGNGKNVIKASFAQYYDQLGPGQISATLNPIGAATIQFPWTDLNGDKVVQVNEVNTSKTLSFGGGYNPANPAQITSPNQIDPSLKNSRAAEVVVGFNKDLSGVGLSVSYIWRNYTNFMFNQVIGITSANYTPATFTPAAGVCPAGARCPSVTYFVPNIPLPSPFVLTNRPDFHQRYQGFEAVGRKRGRKWTAEASYAYNTTVAFYDSAASYVDPTNIAIQNGAQYAPALTTSGFPATNPNAKWIARFNGLYRLPWQDIGVAGTVDAHQGYPFLQVVNVASRPNSAGAVQVLLDPPGDVRLPNFYQTDFRVDKTFAFGRTRVKPTLDIFNLFNSNTILGQNTTQNAINANLISTILAPRIARIGVAVTF